MKRARDGDGDEDEDEEAAAATKRARQLVDVFGPGNFFGRLPDDVLVKLVTEFLPRSASAVSRLLVEFVPKVLEERTLEGAATTTTTTMVDVNARLPNVIWRAVVQRDYCSPLTQKLYSLPWQFGFLFDHWAALCALAGRMSSPRTPPPTFWMNVFAHCSVAVRVALYLLAYQLDVRDIAEDDTVLPQWSDEDMRETLARFMPGVRSLTLTSVERTTGESFRPISYGNALATAPLRVDDAALARRAAEHADFVPKSLSARLLLRGRLRRDEAVDESQLIRGRLRDDLRRAFIQREMRQQDMTEEEAADYLRDEIINALPCFLRTVLPADRDLQPVYALDELIADAQIVVDALVNEVVEQVHEGEEDSDAYDGSLLEDLPAAAEHLEVAPRLQFLLDALLHGWGASSFTAVSLPATYGGVFIGSWVYSHAYQAHHRDWVVDVRFSVLRLDLDALLAAYNDGGWEAAVLAERLVEEKVDFDQRAMVADVVALDHDLAVFEQLEAPAGATPAAYSRLFAHFGRTDVTALFTRLQPALRPGGGGGGAMAIALTADERTLLDTVLSWVDDLPEVIAAESRHLDRTGRTRRPYKTRMVALRGAGGGDE